MFCSTWHVTSWKGSGGAWHLLPVIAITISSRELHANRFSIQSALEGRSRDARIIVGDVIDICRSCSRVRVGEDG